jgi:hypothetical protein
LALRRPEERVLLGLFRKSIEEREARGDVERVFHEIRRVLRVDGIDPIFRSLAARRRLLPAIWDALRPDLETRAFEDAADGVRAEAARAATALPRLVVAGPVMLGPAQLHRLRGALDLYRYANPKLLVLSSAALLALHGERLGVAPGPIERVEPGVPARMLPMEMVAEHPADRRVRATFRAIQRERALPSIDGGWRTLALFPDYLVEAWRRLAPLWSDPEARRHARALVELSRELARTLPFPVSLDRERVAFMGLDPDRAISLVADFERILAPLVLDIAILSLDLAPPDEVARSPFPARPWRGAA